MILTETISKTHEDNILAKLACLKSVMKLLEQFFNVVIVNFDN